MAQRLPFWVVCFYAYAVAKLLKDLPIYEALLERELLRDGSHIKLKEPMVMDFLIEQGTPFVGRELRLLGLPSGCILVRCTEDGHVFVLTATTTREAHMKITVVIAPEADYGLTNLRNGCKGWKT